MSWEGFAWFQEIHFRFCWALQGFACPRPSLSWALQCFAWFQKGPFSFLLGPTGFCVPQAWFDLGPTVFCVVSRGSIFVSAGPYKVLRAPRPKVQVYVSIHICNCLHTFPHLLAVLLSQAILLRKVLARPCNSQSPFGQNHVCNTAGSVLCWAHGGPRPHLLPPGPPPPTHPYIII